MDAVVTIKLWIRDTNRERIEQLVSPALDSFEDELREGERYEVEASWQEMDDLGFVDVHAPIHKI